MIKKKTTRCNSGALADAYIGILSREVPNDPQGATVADLIARTMIRRALKGDIRAIKVITKQVEGRITAAYVRIVNRKAPNDLQRRTFVDLIVEALILRAMEGDVRAFREIVDRVDGPVG